MEDGRQGGGGQGKKGGGPGKGRKPRGQSAQAQGKGLLGEAPGELKKGKGRGAPIPSLMDCLVAPGDVDEAKKARKNRSRNQKVKQQLSVADVLVSDSDSESSETEDQAPTPKKGKAKKAKKQEPKPKVSSANEEKSRKKKPKAAVSQLLEISSESSNSSSSDDGDEVSSVSVQALTEKQIAKKNRSRNKKKKQQVSVTNVLGIDSDSDSSDIEVQAPKSKTKQAKKAEPKPKDSKTARSANEEKSRKKKPKAAVSQLLEISSESPNSSSSDDVSSVVQAPKSKTKQAKKPEPKPEEATQSQKRRERKKNKLKAAKLVQDNSASSSDEDGEDEDADDVSVASGTMEKVAAGLSKDQMDSLKGELLQMLLSERGISVEEEKSVTGKKPGSDRQPATQPGSDRQPLSKPGPDQLPVSKGLPQLCRQHNSKEGCPRGVTCNFVHACRNFVLKGECKFEGQCKGGHNLFDTQPKFLLVKHGVDVQRKHKKIIEEYRKEFAAKEKSEPTESQPQKTEKPEPKPKSKPKPKPTVKKTINVQSPICAFYLRGACQYPGKCPKNHCEQPYHWMYQLMGASAWTDVDKDTNELIEKSYSQPQNTECSTQVCDDQGKKTSFHVNFEKMSVFTGGCPGEIRRLSTVSNVKGGDQVFNTAWQWFWLEEGGSWVTYNQEAADVKKKGTITGRQLEESYQSGKTESALFSTAANKYKVNMDRMVQINIEHGTERPVARRPVFVSADKLELLKQVYLEKAFVKESGCGAQAAESPMPDYWDKSVMDEEEECHLVEMKREGKTKAEYVKLENMFYESMPEAIFAIKKLYRIQNSELWERYERNKAWKKKKSGKDQEEKTLFHGTSTANVDAICQQGFDWRIAGSSVGTRFGKGSYFATTASFAKDYSDTKLLFVVRVLVGESTVGDPDYVKPPPRNPKKPKGPAYDSCVNSLDNPSMYVIFEQERAYAEYLIKFKKNK